MRARRAVPWPGIAAAGQALAGAMRPRMAIGQRRVVGHHDEWPRLGQAIEAAGPHVGEGTEQEAEADAVRRMPRVVRVR